MLVAPLAFTSNAAAEGSLFAYLSHPVLGTNIPQTFTVYVFDVAGLPVTTATVEIICGTTPCDPWTLSADRLVAFGDGTFGNGADGTYMFQVYPWAVGEFVAQVTSGSDVLTLPFSVAGPNLVIADTWAPPEVLEEEPIYYVITFHNQGYGAAGEGLSVLVDGAIVEWGWVSAQPWEYQSLEFSISPLSPGDHTLQVVLDSGLQSVVTTVRVLPLPTLRMADVTTSPLFSTTVPLEMHDVRDFSRAIVQFTYDPMLVKVVTVSAGDVPAMGLAVEHDAAAGIVTIRAATALEGVTGNFTLVDIELSAIEHHNTDSTLTFSATDYRTTSGSSPARGGSAHFHGSLLGTTGDEVLSEL